MSLPYTYLPRPGEGVTVDRHGNGHDDADLTVCSGPAGGTVRIRQDEVPGVAAGLAQAMHEAAGLPAPVILGPPSLPPGVCFYSDGVKVFAYGDRVRLQATESHSAKEYWHAKLTPADARKLAANIVALADFAEKQPSDADVEELAAAIRTAHNPDSGRPGDGDRTAARAALRWFADKHHGGTP